MENFDSYEAFVLKLYIRFTLYIRSCEFEILSQTPNFGIRCPATLRIRPSVLATLPPMALCLVSLLILFPPPAMHPRLRRPRQLHPLPSRQPIPMLQATLTWNSHLHEGSLQVRHFSRILIYETRIAIYILKMPI